MPLSLKKAEADENRNSSRSMRNVLFSSLLSEQESVGLSVSNRERQELYDPSRKEQWLRPKGKRLCKLNSEAVVWVLIASQLYSHLSCLPWSIPYGHTKPDIR